MVNGDFWLVEDEPVAERRVEVSPDESTTGGTRYPQNADENSLGSCRRCTSGTAYLIRFADGTTDVRCDRCFGNIGNIRHVRNEYRRG